MKFVALDDVCRMQQVHDGCFQSIDEVPLRALTLTIPSLLAPTYKFCIVPTEKKSDAVRDMIHGPISEACPASILRTTENAVLFLDQAAYSKV